MDLVGNVDQSGQRRKFNLPIAGLSCALLLLLSFCLETHAAPKEKQVAVFVLTQKSSVFGKQTLYVSRDSMRLDMKRIGSSIVVRPPGHTLQMFSPSKKVYYQLSIEKWHTDMLKPDAFEKKCVQRGIKWRAIRKAEICGIQCDEYIIGRLRGATDPYNLSLPKDPQRRRYFLAKSIPISKAGSTVFSKALNITSLDLLPMKVQIKDKNDEDGMKTVLDTIKCDKKIMPQSFFAVPASFRRTDNEFDVFVDFGNESDPMTGIQDILFKSITGKDKPSK